MKSRFKTLASNLPGVEAVWADTSHSFPRHTHDQFGIGVIERGAQNSWSGRGLVEASAGDTITVNPGEVHDGNPIGDARSWSMLYFDPAKISVAAADLSEGKTGEYELRDPVLHDHSIATDFRKLFQTVTHDETDTDGFCAEEKLLILLGRLLNTSANGAKTAARDNIQSACELIDDNPAAPLTLADLSAETGLSQFKTIRAFSKATGFTPHAYLVQRRLQLARKLIGKGFPLAEAAIASGFSDQSHMTRLFVRNFGYSPGNLAQSIRQSA